MTDKRAKSYWQSMAMESDHEKRAVKSWFGPLCEDMTPYKAEILCDIETDREKKIRAFMVDGSGAKFQFVRTLGRHYSISRKPLSVGASAQAKQEG